MVGRRSPTRKRVPRILPHPTHSVICPHPPPLSRVRERGVVRGHVLRTGRLTGRFTERYTGAGLLVTANRKGAEPCAIASWVSPSSCLVVLPCPPIRPHKIRPSFSSEHKLHSIRASTTRPSTIATGSCNSIPCPRKPTTFADESSTTGARPTPPSPTTTRPWRSILCSQRHIVTEGFFGCKRTHTKRPWPTVTGP